MARVVRQWPGSFLFRHLAIAAPGAKRKRTHRSASIKGETRWERVVHRLKNRSDLARFGVFLAWVVATALVTETWEAPFGYRKSDFVSRGIESRIDFGRVDADETERRKRDAEDRVPLVFRNDPSAIIRLPELLKADLGEISASESIGDVSEATRRSFGFDESVPGDQAKAVFELVRKAIEPAGPLSTETKIKDIVSELGKFLTPLMESGVISPADITRLQLQRGAQIRITPSQDGVFSEPVEPVLLTKVQLSDQLTDVGELGKMWPSYPHLDVIRSALKTWLTGQLKPTLTYDEAATEQAQGAARDNVADVIVRYDVGDRLILPQTLLGVDDLKLLAAEHAAVEEANSSWIRVSRAGLSTLLIGVLLVLNAYFIGRIEPRVIESVNRLTLYAVTVVLTIASARALSFDPWRAEILPVLIASMVFRVAYSQVFATVSAFTLCLLVTLSTTGDVRQFVVLIGTTAACILMIGRVQQRQTLVRVGLLTGLVYIVVFFAIRSVGEQVPIEVMISAATIRDALLGGAWCLFCGYLVTGSLPFVESTFGVVTDISLLELSDPSHPLLQDLVRRAPGTYNHSIAVGSISETAAEAVGANGLLCRVAAYFHDVGKMLKPEYFIENLGAGQESPHTNLSPAMSKLVIIGHVKDGVDLAEQYNLPRPIIDFIEQHHGTTLVEYFFREASKQAERKPDNRTDAEEESYRYPGPKPQTREAGVMMLVDACESASRALTDPTPRRLEQLVRDLLMKRLLDGQFEECNLTLSDLHKIELSIAKSLTAQYHGRIKYPDAKSA